MCYDLHRKFEEDELQLHLRYLDQMPEIFPDQDKNLEELRRQTTSYYHVNGFDHPYLPVLRSDQGNGNFEPMQWGLVPHWCKDSVKGHEIWNRTINARGETMFEKPSFRGAANYRRGVLFVNSFYEHHHFKKKTYPYNIRLKNSPIIPLGVIWDESTFQDTGEIKRTFSIVTSQGNEIMARIHNNPKLKEPRMPLILTEQTIGRWMAPLQDNFDRKEIAELIKPSGLELETRTVKRLRGKEAVGNVPEALNGFDYPELKQGNDQPTLWG